MSKIIKIKKELASFSSIDKQKIFIRFFKTGKGQYGEGDRFIGVTVPEVREVAKKWYVNVTLDECVSLLQSKIHEERLCALIMMVYKYEKSDALNSSTSPPVIPAKAGIHQKKEQIVQIYLANTKYINNWDLVDLSAYKILGQYLLEKNDDTLLLKLAKSENIWERRISMVSTFAFLKNNNPLPTVKIANILLKDNHDLIHKAVGWMLREMGKRVGEDTLIKYLNKHACQMPRTALRYSIEKLPETKRQFYLKLK